jgi:PAS domain S-box-containing protein
MIRGQLGTVEEPDKTPFGTLLRELRTSSGLTQADLAGLAGLSVRGISDLERGARKAPHPHTVRQLASAMHLTDAQCGALLAAARPVRDAPAQLRTIGTAVAAFDVEGRLTTLNGTAKQLFGVSAEDSVGRLYPAILGPALADRLVGLFLHTARSGDPSPTREVRAILPSGRQVVLRAAVGPISDPRGRLLGVLLVAEEHTSATESSATRTAGDELAYGVGVHTGEVVVGNLGTADYMNYTAVGDTVNVAARLQSAAAAGEVLCSAAALDQAGGGVLATHLGELAVKGRAHPVDAYRVDELAE